MSGVRDFSSRPDGCKADSDEFMGWVDDLGNRQNIDMLIPLTSLAPEDEIYIFDASTGKTFKTTLAILKTWILA